MMPPPLRRLLEKLAFKIAVLQANDQLRSVVEQVSEGRNATEAVVSLVAECRQTVTEG